MAQIEVNRVTNANVYINGNSFLGKAEEIDLPKIVSKMVEHKALGMQGAIELPAGFEKMEARIKWNSYYKDAMLLSSNPFTFHSIQCRSSLENYTAGGRTGEAAVVVFMRGQFKGTPTGNFKQHDNVELETNIAVTYVKVEIGGDPIVEFDAIANIYKVGGIDISANYRANIGG